MALPLPRGQRRSGTGKRPPGVGGGPRCLRGRAFTPSARRSLNARSAKAPDLRLHPTSSPHYWFQYSGGEHLEFRGSDDVWLFVNGQLAVDLGGIHNELSGVVTLNGASTQACSDNTPPACAGQQVCDTPAPPNCTTFPGGFDMVPGNIYEIAVFQAQRRVTASNFKLTISDSIPPPSACSSL